MQIPVVGMDPSFRNWGIASGTLDLDTGVLSTPHLAVVKTGEEPKGKQVRQNSYDLEAAETLAKAVTPVAQYAKVVFVEVPHGAQSASGAKGNGVVYGILGSLRARGIQIIEVTEAESKKLFAGKRTATKDDMIRAAVEFYPNANWPRQDKNGAKFQKGDIKNEAEHMADAIAAIHAGVHTPMFQNLMRLFAKV
jgi:hypothetical protein